MRPWAAAAPSPFARPVEPSEPTEPPHFELDQVSESGDQLLVAGEKVELPGDAEEPQIPIALLVENDEVEGTSAFVRVAGANEFYHLVFLGDPPQSQQDDSSQEDQQKQEQQQQSDQKEPGESEQQQGDEQKEQAEESEGSDQPQPGDEDEQEPQTEQRQDTSAAEPGEPDSEEEQRQAAQSGPEEVQMERIEDLLEALEQTDDNFQMRKALENMPGRYIEKDW